MKGTDGQLPIWQPGAEWCKPPEFLRLDVGQRVHVLHHWSVPKGVEGIPAMLMAKAVTRCRRRNRSTLPQPEAWVSRFADVDLCPACLDTVPDDYQHELFAHPQPGDGG